MAAQRELNEHPAREPLHTELAPFALQPPHHHRLEILLPLDWHASGEAHWIEDLQQSLVKSQAPWCFLSVGGLERAAPRWVFLDGLDAQPMLDLGEISTELRSRLGESVDSRERNEQSDQLIAHFVDRLRDHELDLLPVRRRALRLLTDTLRDWIEDARRGEDYQRHRALRELQEWLSLPTRERGGHHPDPGSIAEAWLRLLRPRIREALAARTRRRRPWSLEQLRAPLSEDPISIDHLWRAFEGVPNLAPIEERVLALIVGVAE